MGHTKLATKYSSCIGALANALQSAEHTITEFEKTLALLGCSNGNFNLFIQILRTGHNTYTDVVSQLIVYETSNLGRNEGDCEAFYCKPWTIFL